MAKGPKKQTRETSVSTASAARPQPNLSPTPAAWLQWLPWVALGLTALAYIPALGADYVNWDDGDYVYDKGKLLLSDNARLWELLTTPVQGNFQPLTMLSLKINYWISGLEPWSYHLLNVLFHLANTLLVWVLAKKLSDGNLLVAFLCALLFGVHPMHVESVAWISERKDVLYTLFFLGGLWSYLKYAESGSTAHYALALVWGSCSLLSKPAAVVFPAVLFTFDYLRARPLNAKLFLEKIPFVGLALGLALLTLKFQSEIGATEGTEIFGMGKRLLFACYGLMMYAVKMVVPYPAVPFYPFPPLNESPTLPYLIAPVVVAGMIGLAFLAHRRQWRAVAFGLAFYAINLALVLQLIPVGSAVIAERYTYVPYIGLFFALGWALDRWLKGTATAWALTATLGAVFTALCFVQVGVWKSGETLWDHTIRHYPSSRAYVNRAILYREQMKEEPNNSPNKKLLGEKAISLYTLSIAGNAKDHEAHSSRGNVYFDFGNYQQAIADYDKALSIKPDHINSLDNRGAAYAFLKQYDKALQDFVRAIEIDSAHPSVYKNRGVTLYEMGRFAESRADYLKYLQFEPMDFAVMNSVGVCEQGLGQYEQSINTFTKAIQDAQKAVVSGSLKPIELEKTNNNINVLLQNRAISYYNFSLMQKDRAAELLEAARNDVRTVAQRGGKNNPAFLQVIGM
jgi:tetratricopeptide (TPR) repeat protein